MRTCIRSWHTILGVFAITVSLAVAACAPQQTAQPTQTGQSQKPAPSGPQRGGTLRIGVDGEPGGLDPHKVTGGLLLRFSRLFYNTLANTDEAGNIKPELAESWSTPDNKTFVFKLRQGVKFHDGTDFNAEAVKFNFDRVMGPDATGSRRTHLADGGLTSVEVVDDYTVKFTLKAPNASFPAYLTNSGSAIAVSPTGVKKWGDQFILHPVGTGPFELVEWAKGDHMTVKRFDGYWRKDEKGNPLPYVDQIIIRPIADENVRLNGLRAGDLDLVDYVGPSDLATVKGDSNLKSTSWGNSRLSLVLGCTKPPFNNKALRQAVAWAIDREAIHKAIYAETGAPAEAMLDPKNWAFDPQGKFYKRDLAKAKEKLAEGGKPTGFKFDAYNYNTPIDLRASEAMRAQLAEAGINMEVVPQERAQLNQTLNSGAFEASFSMGYGMPEDPDIELSKVLGSKGAYNFGKCTTSDAEPLLSKAQQTSDQAERKALYAKVQTAYLDDSPQIFVHHSAIATAMNKNVQGFVPNIDLNHIVFDWLWLQK